MEKEKKISIVMGAIFFIVVASTTAIILILGGQIGQKTLDYGGTIAGISQFIFGIAIFKAIKNFYLKALAFFVIVMGLAMIIVHVFGILSM